MDAITGTGTAYPSETREFPHGTHPYMCLCDHIDNYCTRKENYLEPSIVKVRFNQ
jgi:hypothetical protein